MNHEKITTIGNTRLDTLVEREYARFKEIIESDIPIGFIEEKVREIALTEFLDEEKLESVVNEIREEISDSCLQKMEDIMYCSINELFFKDLSISMYNAKRILGCRDAFALIKEQIQDPIIIGNIILLDISLKMEVDEIVESIG